MWGAVDAQMPKREIDTEMRTFINRLTSKISQNDIRTNIMGNQIVH